LRILRAKRVKFEIADSTHKNKKIEHVETKNENRNWKNKIKTKKE